MSIVNPANIRNIGIMAHIDAGKTTLSERILFYTEKIHRLGEVHDGAATMDYMPEEQERGITITSACSTCRWQGKNINVVDTPGHVDFTMEVERSLRVLDGAVGVFCAVGGVEPQSETVWRQSNNFQTPKLAFINKMDRVGADFAAVLEAMRARLQASPAPLTIPLGSGENFTGILDIVNQHKILFNTEDQGRTFTITPFTEDEAKIAAPWREKLFEALADADDEFMAKWLEESWTIDDAKNAIRRATRACAITPCYAGSALRNIGIQPLLDGIVDWLPSPLDARPAEGQLKDGKTRLIKPDPAAAPIALVFKIIMEGSRKNAFLRLYTGTLREGLSLMNNRTGKMDRAGRLFRLHADRHENLDELGPGDIAAVVGLRDAQTGDTYSLKNDPVMLEPIRAYAPVITIALEPLNADEGKILDEALARYTEEDPTLKTVMDEESGMRELSGMGELHLDVTIERLEREYKISPRAGQPRAVMRETITSSASGRALFDRELGKEKHLGEVAIEVTPAERGSGNTLTDFLPKDSQEARKLMPPVYVQAVYEGLENALSTGVSSGWPITDVNIHIADIAYNEGATTVPGLRMAAAQALQEAMRKARPALLEPIMEVDITCPEEFLGSAISLFTQTGGKIEGMDEKSGIREIHGIAPLQKLFGFSTPLRSATQGRAGFTMTFKKFDLA